MKLKIEPVPPFDFNLSARIFSEGDKQIRKYENGKYWQVVRVNSKLILVTIRSSGVVNRPELMVNLKTNEEVTGADKRMIGEIVSTLFNLKLDLNQFYKDVESDKILYTLTEKLRGLKSPSTPTVFEALIESIIQQQISLNVAHGLETRVTRTFGDVLKVAHEIYYAFPTAQSLASASTMQLRECGLSLKKAEYIMNISRLVADEVLDLEKFRDYENTKEIVDELDDIRGIGVWTAELTVVRGIQKLDAIPADDLGLRRCIAHYYRDDKMISSDDARRIAEKWGRWKGLASFYLIVAERLGVKA
jgi:DNA-3-methyladenine glycosylase II